MDDDPADSVRTMKDSSLVGPPRPCATARPRPWSPPATPAPPWARPCCAWAGSRASPARRSPPRSRAPGCAGGARRSLLDAGANAECQPGVAGAVRPDGRGLRPAPLRHRRPRRSALLSIGEEPTKGNALVKETHALLAADGGAALGAAGATFVGNVEGRDLMTDAVDVVVHRRLHRQRRPQDPRGRHEDAGQRPLRRVRGHRRDPGRRRRAAARTCCRSTAPSTPNNTGGAMLLGVDGVCIISHGSSNATAIVNAVRVAAEAVEADLVGAPAHRRRRLTAPADSAFTSARSAATAYSCPPDGRRDPRRAAADGPPSGVRADP